MKKNTKKANLSYLIQSSKKLRMDNGQNKKNRLGPDMMGETIPELTLDDLKHYHLLKIDD